MNFDLIGIIKAGEGSEETKGLRKFKLKKKKELSMSWKQWLLYRWWKSQVDQISEFFRFSEKCQLITDRNSLYPRNWDAMTWYLDFQSRDMLFIVGNNQLLLAMFQTHTHTQKDESTVLNISSQLWQHHQNWKFVVNCYWQYSSPYTQ